MKREMLESKLNHLALIVDLMPEDKLEIVIDKLISKNVEKFSLCSNLQQANFVLLNSSDKNHSDLKFQHLPANKGREILLNKFKSFLKENYDVLGTSSLEDYDQKLREFMVQDSEFTEPDLIIVLNDSGGSLDKKSLSNNLIWESNYAEIYFPPKSSQDFDVDDLGLAIEDYYTRQRNFGE